MFALMPIANFFLWFATTKVGRILGLVALVLGAVAVLWFKAKASGRAQARAEIKHEGDVFISDKRKIDADIHDDSDADLAKRVRPWVSKRR